MGFLNTIIEFEGPVVDVFVDSLDELTDALSAHHPDLQRIGVF